MAAPIEPRVDKDGVAGLCGRASAHESVVNLGGRLHQNALRAESGRDLVISAAREYGAGIILEDLHLFAGNLRPGRIIADNRNDGDAMTHEAVELRKAIATGAIAEQDPDFGLRAT